MFIHRFKFEGQEVCGQPHASAQDARECEADYVSQVESYRWEMSLDLCPICDGAHSWRGLGCYFENRGSDEAYAEEQWEAARGVIPFNEALDAALAAL